MTYAADSLTSQDRKSYRDKLRGLHCGYVEVEEEDFCVETVLLQEPYSCVKKEKQIRCHPAITSAPRICHKVGVRWKTKACTLVDYELKCTQRLVDQQQKCTKEWMIQQPYPCALSSTVESCVTQQTPVKDQCTKSIVKSVPYTCIKEELQTFCNRHPAFLTTHSGVSVDGSHLSEEATPKRKERNMSFKILRKLKHVHDVTATRLTDADMDTAAVAESLEAQDGSIATSDVPTHVEQNVPYRCSRPKAKPECKTVTRKETGRCMKDKPLVSTFDCSYTEVQMNCNRKSHKPSISTGEGRQQENKGDGKSAQSDESADKREAWVSCKLSAHNSPAARAQVANTGGSQKSGKGAVFYGTRNAKALTLPSPQKPFSSPFRQERLPQQTHCHYAPVTVTRYCKEIIMSKTEEACEIESKEKVCKTEKQEHPHICYMKKASKKSSNPALQQPLAPRATVALTPYHATPAAAEGGTLNDAVAGVPVRPEPVKKATKASSVTGVSETEAAQRPPRVLSAPSNCVTRVVSRKGTCAKKLSFTEFTPCTSNVPVTTCSPTKNVDTTTCYRAVQKSMEYKCVKPAKVEECVPVPVHRQGTCYEQEEYEEAFECEETQVQQICKEEEKELSTQCTETVQRELSYPCKKQKHVPLCLKEESAHTLSTNLRQILSQQQLAQEASAQLQWQTNAHAARPVSSPYVVPRPALSDAVLKGASAEPAVEQTDLPVLQDEQRALLADRSAIFDALDLVRSAEAASTEALADAAELTSKASENIDSAPRRKADTTREEPVKERASAALKTAEAQRSLREPVSPIPLRAHSLFSLSYTSASSVCDSNRGSCSTSATSRSPAGWNNSKSATRGERTSKSRNARSNIAGDSTPSESTRSATGAAMRRLLHSFKPLGLKSKKHPPFSATTAHLPPPPPPVDRMFLGPRGTLLNGSLQKGHAPPANGAHVQETPHQPVLLPDPATVDMHNLVNQHHKYLLTSPDQILPLIPPRGLPAGVFSSHHHILPLADAQRHAGIPLQRAHHVPVAIPPPEIPAGAQPPDSAPHTTQDAETVLVEFKPMAPLRPGSRVPSLLDTNISSPLPAHPTHLEVVVSEQKAAAGTESSPPAAEDDVSSHLPSRTHWPTQVSIPVSDPAAAMLMPRFQEEALLAKFYSPHQAAAGAFPIGYPWNGAVHRGAVPAAVVPTAAVAPPDWTFTAPAAFPTLATPSLPTASPLPPVVPTHPYPVPYGHAPPDMLSHVDVMPRVAEPHQGTIPQYPITTGSGLDASTAGGPISPLIAPGFHYPHLMQHTGPAGGIPEASPLPPYHIFGPPLLIPSAPRPIHAPYMHSGDPYQEAAAIAHRSSHVGDILQPARGALPEFHKLQELTAEIHYLMKLQRQQKGCLSDSHRQRLKQITVELEELAGIKNMLPEDTETDGAEERSVDNRESEQPSRRPSPHRCDQDEYPPREMADQGSDVVGRRNRLSTGRGDTKKSAEVADKTSHSPVTHSERPSTGASQGNTLPTRGGQGTNTYNNEQHRTTAGKELRAVLPRHFHVDSEELKQVLNALLAELEADELTLFEELRKSDMTVEYAEELTGELALLREDIKIVGDARARLITGELSYEEIQNLWGFLLGENASDAIEEMDSLQEEMEEHKYDPQKAPREKDTSLHTERQWSARERISSYSDAPPSKGADLLGVSAESAALAAAAAALHKVMTATFARIPLIAQHHVADTWEDAHIYDTTYVPTRLEAPVPVTLSPANVVLGPTTSTEGHEPAFHLNQQQHHLQHVPHHHHNSMVHAEPVGAREAMLAAALEGAFEIKARIMHSIHALQQLLDTTDMPLDREAEAKQLLSALQRDLLRVQHLVGRLQHGEGLSNEDLQYISMQLEAVNSSAQTVGEPAIADAGRQGRGEAFDGEREQSGVAVEAGGFQPVPDSRFKPSAVTPGGTGLNDEAARLSQCGGERLQPSPSLSSPPSSPPTARGATNEGSPARTNVYITINIDENGDMDMHSPQRKTG